MADAGEDDDLSLVRASSSLLQDLERSLPRLLYRRTKEHGKLVAHSSVRHVDLEHTIRLIDPFQSDPQLLDAHLKTIVPQNAEALLQHLARGSGHEKPHCVSLTDAASTLLYNLCKVRGRKIVSALLPNEPRHLELVVAALERHGQTAGQWQTHFSLLLWLSHLLLAPFALATISSEVQDVHLPEQLVLDDRVPQVARRCICIALSYLGSSSIAQTAAALVLARLVTRPDMQVLKLADDIVDYILPQLSDTQSAGEQIHRQLGALRLLVAISKSGDVDHLFPRIFAACESHIEQSTPLTGNAVARKLILKAMSTPVLTSLRSAHSDGTHTALLNEGDALETTIEYHLRCLADHESLVRHAAAKSISAIVLGLDSSMSQDILDAVLQAIEEETPADGQLHTANAFAWHGNVLTLAYALFKRSISIERLPAVVRALLLAIAFEQRTANGAVTGTSVRDAANFGLWSLARRFTTRELSEVNGEAGLTIFELLATNLLQAACLDPVGNIRRGSSAALQELVGRHPDRIPAGISLVQVVDFVAVGLRRRAMLEVAAKAAALDDLYWTAITTGLAGWKGLGSADAASREHAAQCIPSQYAGKDENTQRRGLSSLVSVLEQCSEHDYEQLHGLVLCFAYWIPHSIETASSVDIQNIWTAVEQKKCFVNAFALRALRTELTLALIRFTTAYCDFRLQGQDDLSSTTLSTISEFQQRLFSRHEESIREKIPMLVRASHRAGICLQSKQSMDQLLLDCSKPTLHGCGRAHALAELTVFLPQEMTGNVSALCQVCSSSQVDWRVVGYEALSIVLPHVPTEHEMFKTICKQLMAGMRDYTIDQRGDVGSLVRLQAIEGTQILLIAAADYDHTQELESEILRLSLERLNRVRAAAAKCRMHLPMGLAVAAQEDLDSENYFEAVLSPLWKVETPCWARRALLEGVTSCAGSAAEHLIQNSRAVLARRLSDMSLSTLSTIMQDFTEMLKTMQSLPLLDLLAFFLQARILQRLTDANYKWRNLLAIVQRAHYKSTDIPKILTAVSIYACLSEQATIKTEVVRKLLSMLKTNPYPKVRSAVADALYTTTLQSDMKTHDWSRAPGLNKAAVATLETTL